MAIYIGFDSSTQSLTAAAIEIEGGRRDVLLVHTITFDQDLPEYGTRHGGLPSDEPLVAVAPPLMWVDALDRMMAWLSRSGIDLSRVAAVSGAAQQHGSVYLSAAGVSQLAALRPDVSIVDQIAPGLSRAVAPIWLDASTSEECREIAVAAGGEARLAAITGSRAFERFTGPQIRRFAKIDPAGYSATARVHLVSSFLASVLIGGDAPLDPGDASGMNLMALATATWDAGLATATAPGLFPRLPRVVPSSTIVGTIAPYWRERHGWPAARVAAWTGDNPSSLVGLGLVCEGRLGISLGTSDTVFGFLAEPRVDPSGTGHVFGAPTGHFMGLTCFTNGSLARERVRDAFGLDWAGFSRLLRETPAGNGGRMLLPWFVPEITPPVLGAGARSYGIEAGDGPAHVRAVVEAQMLALARHSQWMGLEVADIYVTGGAAANRDLLQVMADVFDAPVHQLEVGNAAALGAALRAVEADTKATGASLPWEAVVEGFVEPLGPEPVRPAPERARVHAAQREVHEACEAHALGRGPDPREALAAFAAQHAPWGSGLD